MRERRTFTRFGAPLFAVWVLLCQERSARSDSAAPDAASPPIQASASIGAGVFVASGDGAAALFRARLEADASPNATPQVSVLCPATRRGLGVDCGTDQHLYARLDTVGAFSATPQGPAVPYLDIRFYPKENQIYAPIPSESRNAFVGDLQLLPFEIGRDLAVDETLKLVASALRASPKYWVPVGPNFALFIHGALDVLGYKATRSASGGTPFDGVHVAGGDLRLGIGWGPWSDLAIDLAVGGSVDFNRWTRSQSDATLAAMLTADVMDFLRVFVQPQFVSQWDGQHDWTKSTELLGGVDVVF